MNIPKEDQERLEQMAKYEVNHVPNIMSLSHADIALAIEIISLTNPSSHSGEDILLHKLLNEQVRILETNAFLAKYPEEWKRLLDTTGAPPEGWEEYYKNCYPEPYPEDIEDP